MMASMAVGGAVGQNIAGSMNNMMSGMNQPIQSDVTPPPVPGISYYVAVNGQAKGPYEPSTLKQMINDGQFNIRESCVEIGMSEWEKAGNLDDLKSMFVIIPPIPSI